MENDVCLCGHRLFCHLDYMCLLCKELWLESNIVYHSFRADNLKYLETIYSNKAKNAR